MIPGLDSAYPPTAEQAITAYTQGYRWWGFYIGGVGNTDPLNAWKPGDVQVLTDHLLQPVPIVVPNPVGSDPVLTAQQAYASARTYGLSPKVSICYNGEHISVSGPVWLPMPGQPPLAVGPGSAIQYGGSAIGDLGVDLNLSANDFPMSEGIACDLEHGDAYSSAWYTIFQNTITQLAVQPPAPPPPKYKDDTMTLVICTSNYTEANGTVIPQGGQWVIVGDKILPVAEASDSAAVAQSYPTVQWSGQQIAAMLAIL